MIKIQHNHTVKQSNCNHVLVIMKSPLSKWPQLFSKWPQTLGAVRRRQDSQRGVNWGLDPRHTAATVAAVHSRGRRPPDRPPAPAPVSRPIILDITDTVAGASDRGGSQSVMTITALKHRRWVQRISPTSPGQTDPCTEERQPPREAPAARRHHRAQQKNRRLRGHRRTGSAAPDRRLTRPADGRWRLLESVPP